MSSVRARTSDTYDNFEKPETVPVGESMKQEEGDGHESCGAEYHDKTSL